MRALSRVAVVAPLICLLAVGCAGPDMSAVPATAETPFICDGVPQRGFELALGDELTLSGDAGAWGHDAFICRLEAAGSDDHRAVVEQERTRSAREGISGDELWLERLAGFKQATAIEADAPGAGFVYDWTVNDPLCQP